MRWKAVGTVCGMERTDAERHDGLRCKVPQMGGPRNANATPNSPSIGDVCTVLYRALEAREGSQAGNGIRKYRLLGRRMPAANNQINRSRGAMPQVANGVC